MGVMRSIPTLAALLSLIATAGQAAGVTYLNGPMPRFGTQAAPARPSGYTAAPLPNPDAALPRPPPLKPGEAELAPSLRSETPQGRPGSSFSEELQRKNRGGTSITPSLTLRVPVDN